MYRTCHRYQEQMFATDCSGCFAVQDNAGGPAVFVQDVQMLRVNCVRIVCEYCSL